jgi:hypothetical protein
MALRFELKTSLCRGFHWSPWPNHYFGLHSMKLFCRAIAACVLVSTTMAVGADNPAVMSLAGGKLQLTAPADWVRKQPQSSIVEHEFAVKASDGDTADGRVTVMSAGGGIEANIDRWYGQFTQPDGGSTRDRAKLKQIKVAGEEVHLVDMSGTFKDQRGPAAPAVERPKYRMLAAIIPIRSQGTYFVKFYGPQRTVSDHEKAFLTMIEGLEHK